MRSIPRPQSAVGETLLALGGLFALCVAIAYVIVLLLPYILVGAAVIAGLAAAWAWATKSNPRRSRGGHP